VTGSIGMMALDYPVSWMILLTYLVQAIVIIFFPVPSEVSTLQLLKQNPAGVHSMNRLLLVGLGILGILTFHLPLLFALLPASVPWQLLIFERMYSVTHHIIVGLCLLSGTTICLLGVLSQWRDRRRIQGAVPRQLQTDGIYGLCRHPINLGLMLIMLGFILAYPLWFMLPGVLAFYYNLHLRARMEENYLIELHGNSYRDYQQRVPMYGLPTSPK